MRWTFILLVVAGPAFAHDLYVSPGGKDADPGTANQPLATPARALVVARERRKPGEPTSIHLAVGRYQLDAPLTLTPADSGIRLVADGLVTLSGGLAIKGWSDKGSGVWMADLPAEARGLTFRHITVNGAMRHRPRLPRQGTYTIVGLAGADPKGKYNTPADRFEFRPGDIDASWKNLTDVEVVVLHFWVDNHFGVRSIDADKHVVVFDRFSRRRFTETGGQSAPARYYLTNVAEAFTEPGTFYHDRAAGTLAYRPLPGEDLATADIVVPRLQSIVRIESDPAGQRVEHVALEGLTFADMNWQPSAKEAVDAQAASVVPGAVWLREAHHCTLERCTVTGVAGYGIDIAEGCRDNRIARCEVRHCGAGGLRMTGGAAGSPPEKRTGANIVEDCQFHHLGELFHSGIGVLLMHTDGNIVRHNHIHHLYYTGISCGWIWGYAPSVSHSNRLENNHIHDVGQKLLSDMGGIYMLGVSPGTVVRGNVIHDIDAFTYGGWGIYTDEGSSGITIEKNLVYRTKTGGFHQHYGKENIVRNNIFALARENQIERTRQEPHRSFTFERNLVYFRQGELLGKRWADDQFAMDYNLYWRADGKPITFPGGKTFAEWQARGFDRHSIIADPLFVDPDKGDFRLRPGSPATKIGFEPWDTSVAGARR